MKDVCGCGCGKKRALHRHHVIYQQKLREIVRRGRDEDKALREATLVADRRNIVMLGYQCHAAHHNGQRKLRAKCLPDSVFEFAIEHMSAGEAYEYLRRRYAGEDWRLDELLGRSQGEV